MAASWERFPCEVDGGKDDGKDMTLCVPDGGLGHESSDGEKTLLLAMLTPPSES